MPQDAALAAGARWRQALVGPLAELQAAPVESKVGQPEGWAALPPAVGLPRPSTAGPAGPSRVGSRWREIPVRPRCAAGPAGRCAPSSGADRAAVWRGRRPAAGLRRRRGSGSGTPDRVRAGSGSWQQPWLRRCPDRARRPAAGRSRPAWPAGRAAVQRHSRCGCEQHAAPSRASRRGSATARRGLDRKWRPDAGGIHAAGRPSGPGRWASAGIPANAGSGRMNAASDALFRELRKDSR